MRALQAAVIFTGFQAFALAQTAAPTGGPDAAAIFATSMQSFQSGDYAGAAAGLEKVIAAAVPGPQLEPVYYSLGAAYFNVPDFEKAIPAFGKYLSTYPQGSHRGEITLSLGRALLETKKFAEAAASFQEVETLPGYREEALVLKASALKQAGKPAEAIVALEKLIAPGIASQATASAAIQLAALYAEKKDTAKSIATLQLVRTKLALMDNVLELNALAIGLGDDFLSNKQLSEALICYGLVQVPAQVIKLQENRVQRLEAQLEKNVRLLPTLRADPEALSKQIAANNQLKTTVQDASKLVEQARALPDFTPGLYLRIARAYYQLSKKWHAVVAYGEILRRYPTSPEQEAALFGVTVTSAEAGRVEAAKSYAEEYLKTYPSNPNAQTVGFLLGQSALQTGDATGAESYFGRILKEQPTSQFREEMIFLMANARFGLGKFDESVDTYATYSKEFPSGAHVEEVEYRSGLAKLFAGKYEEALGKLQAYQTKYPEGTFISDVGYRVDVCKYSASLYDEVVADTTAWEGKYKGDRMLGEVLALKADALAALGKNDEATPVYVSSSKVATTDEVLNYSLFAAQKLMQKKSDWAGISRLFEEFVAERPQHPTVVSALYWIGKAKAREGKIDEARTFTADTIKKFIDDPKRDAVEQLLTQLSQLCLKKTPAATVEAGAASTAPTYDPQAELDRLLGSGETPIARARVLFAKAELARLRKKPLEEQAALQAIADNNKPEDLSAVLLAQIGDFLLAKDQIEKAEPFFRRLMTAFPKSDYADFAWNGLGEIAFQRKEYPKALGYFRDAIDKIGATSKLKDVTVGQAKTLLAMGKLDEAKKIFEQVASIREWRGDSTAFSVFSLGEIERQNGRLPEAIAFYQRVYVAYRRFLPWVAKSYLNSAQCFEKLGKTEEAIRTYQEMLRQEKLATFPESASARERLKTLSPG